MRLTILSLLLVLASTSYSQKYTAIHVIGKIYDTSTKQYLRSGSRLNESSKLKFETPSARAAVLSSKRGRYIIQKSKKITNQSDLGYALSSVLSPARGKLSTRAGAINNQMDFNNQFGEGPVAWIGENYKISVSESAYPMDEDHFFYVNYLYFDQIANKKLESENTNIIFNRSTFYTIDEQPIDPYEVYEMTLFYYDARLEESTQITTLDFYLVNKEDLDGIIEGLSELNEEEKNTALSEIIQSLYGKVSSEEIKAALDN